MKMNIMPEALIGLRMEKAWTQEHLAQAAGVATRTVQRAEHRGHCSAETILAIAGALDVDVAQLLAPSTAHDDAGHINGRSPTPFGHFTARLLLRQLTAPQRAAWSFVALLPAAYFATANILYYRLDIPILYLPLRSLLGTEMTGTFFNLISPILFMGGLAWAILVNLDTLLSMRLTPGDAPLSGTFHLRPRLANAAILGIASIYMGLMVLYMIVETAGHI